MKSIKKLLSKIIVNVPFSTQIYYTYCMRRLKKQFSNKLKINSWLKTEQDSKNMYDKYGDREQKEYEFSSELCLYKGKLAWMRNKEVRNNYLKYLFEEIEKEISDKKQIKVLEVGCGNCINLVNLKEKFGNQIELYGLDISNERIEVAKRYFSGKLDRIIFYQKSITERCNEQNDDYFDIVFSMHCLEQIPYSCSIALKEMYRIAKKKIILIEPIFENGNPVQKLYLINSDHNRILIKSIRDLGYKIQRNESLDIQSGGGINQSSIITIKK
ncbi:MAG: hypothetical protein COZ53_02310 [Candidatus Altarchaeum sp. CG_4_8_14_3_um_filter_33_2054]|nr:MAG: hypothetical protein AUK59_05935 [Candidatus Altarchaeum sp. CG2_30_32_3053]PIX48942.1 MAG: hypothetical protein COZ53_02310 [Candidatus Altarchaeum sp. CG_4_8_14_3_um_filter_33_2054]PIZ32391.1 MAG: hypothetical protein COY41_01225 [Candidatus Altarchaeum sp. CG_4_10_14_0_8_um_filter_32_851]